MKSSIGIFGDSFADPNNEFGDTAWPYLMQLEEEDRSDIEITCYSQSGTSQWWSFEKFLKNYESHDIIIFAHADSQRIPSIPEKWGGNHYRTLDLNSAPICSEDKDHIEHAIKTYWENFYNPYLLDFLYQRVLDEVNLLCKRGNIRVINLFASDEIKKMSDNRGICIYNLFEVSRKELQLIHPKAWTPVDIGFEMDVRACHLTQENNHALASLISQCLLDYDNINQSETIDFSQFSEIVIDHDVSSRYFATSKVIE